MINSILVLIIILLLIYIVQLKYQDRFVQVKDEIGAIYEIKKDQLIRRSVNTMPYIVKTGEGRSLNVDII